MNEEHPFEVACKLARSVYDREERKRLRAAIKAEQILAAQSGYRKPRPSDVTTRVFGVFNGHPMTGREVRALFPCDKVGSVRAAITKLCRQGRLNRISEGVYQRIQS